MLEFLRPTYQALLRPVAAVLTHLGVSANAVSVAGTLGVVAASVWWLGRGHFLAGSALVALFLLGDGLDGAVARLTGGGSRFGAFLDSTLDRVADAAVFGSLAWWFATSSHLPGLAAAVMSLVAALLVSYARARAEVEGWRADAGPAERTDRLVICLVGTGLVGLGAPVEVAVGALWLVAALSILTVARRIRAAAAQAGVATPG
ncbi:MAG: phosphatidylinositol phosphate synthase [Arachnia sp.]